MALQVALVRALRESGAVRAFVEVPDEAHAASFERALGLPPFERSLEPARRVVLPRDDQLQPADLEPAVPAS